MCWCAVYIRFKYTCQTFKQFKLFENWTIFSLNSSLRTTITTTIKFEQRERKILPGYSLHDRKKNNSEKKHITAIKKNHTPTKFWISLKTINTSERIQEKEKPKRIWQRNTYSTIFDSYQFSLNIYLCRQSTRQRKGEKERKKYDK